jgi:hypothetical protein
MIHKSLCRLLRGPSFGKAYFIVRGFETNPSSLFWLSQPYACSVGFWMSDKPLVQQELSHELANLILIIPSLEAAIGFIRGFWEAMVREWAGIDRYR